jgi:hypothetical protein
VAEGCLLSGGRGGAGVDGPVSFFSVSTCRARDDKDSIFMHLNSRATVFSPMNWGWGLNLICTVLSDKLWIISVSYV